MYGIQRRCNALSIAILHQKAVNCCPNNETTCPRYISMKRKRMNSLTRWSFDADDRTQPALIVRFIGRITGHSECTEEEFVSAVEDGRTIGKRVRKHVQAGAGAILLAMSANGFFLHTITQPDSSEHRSCVESSRTRRAVRSSLPHQMYPRACAGT